MPKSDSKAPRKRVVRPVYSFYKPDKIIKPKAAESTRSAALKKIKDYLK